MIDAQTLPAVNYIIAKAEADIQHLCGVKVTLSPKIETGENPVTVQTMKDRTLREIVCRVCEVTWDEIAGKSRVRRIIRGRHMYCFFAREYLKLGLRFIGDRINKDHTSVISAKDTVKDLLDTKDEEYTRCFNLISLELKAALQ